MEEFLTVKFVNTKMSAGILDMTVLPMKWGLEITSPAKYKHGDV